MDGLRRRAYAELFDATWGGWDEARHSRHFLGSMRRGHISIIEVDGDRVGMIQVFEDDRGVEVGEIQIDPSHQGRGIGTSVLLEVLSDADAQGREVSLRVGLRNDRAIRLYERLGFRTVERTATHRHMRHEGVQQESP